MSAAAPADKNAGGVKKLDMAKVGEVKKPDGAPTDEAVVVFHLPDGKTSHTENFRVGWTVGYLKLQLDNKFQLQYDKQELFLGEIKAPSANAAANQTTTGTLASVSNGKSSMADPLTLSDYQVKPAYTVHIFVKVCVPSQPPPAVYSFSADQLTSHLIFAFVSSRP